MYDLDRYIKKNTRVITDGLSCAREHENPELQTQIVAELTRHFNVHPDDISELVPLSKGMTNHSYLFTCKGNQYILRIPGEGTEDLVDREHEAAVYKVIASLGLCDDPVYIDTESGLKITGFLENVHTCDPYNEGEVDKCMSLLRKLHERRLNVDHGVDLFENIAHYESLAVRNPVEHNTYFETKEKVLSLRRYVESHKEESCLTHIDAVPGNFLFYNKDGTEQLQLTDWEYAGMQDPHVDLAMFCLSSRYDRKHVDRLIDIYFENRCDKTTRAKVYCYISICGLMWSNWAEYKRIHGIEFGDYAEVQLQYAIDYYKIAMSEITSITEKEGG